MKIMPFPRSTGNSDSPFLRFPFPGQHHGHHSHRTGGVPDTFSALQSTVRSCVPVVIPNFRFTSPQGKHGGDASTNDSTRLPVGLASLPQFSSEENLARISIDAEGLKRQANSEQLRRWETSLQMLLSDPGTICFVSCQDLSIALVV